MQISFDLLNVDEAGEVLKIIVHAWPMLQRARDEHVRYTTNVVNVTADCDIALDAPAVSLAPAPATVADPLDGAPLPAAADLFSTAPAGPTAGIPMPHGAELPPVPIVPAQTPALSAPAGTVSPADVDKDGLPWDARIHASTKARNADGRWRQKRNLDGQELVRVEVELRHLMSLPVPAAAATSAIPLPPSTPVHIATEAAIPAPPAMDPAPLPFVAAAPSAVDVPNVPPAPVSSVPATAPIPSPPASAAPIAAESTAPITFAAFMTKVTGNLQANRLTTAQVHEALRSVGLEQGQIGHLAAREDLRVAAGAYIDNILAQVQ